MRAAVFVLCVLCLFARAACSVVECSPDSVTVDCEIVAYSHSATEDGSAPGRPLADGIRALLLSIGESYSARKVRITTEVAIDNPSIESIAQFIISEDVSASIVELDISGVRMSTPHIALLVEALAVRSCLLRGGGGSDDDDESLFHITLNSTVIPAIAKKAKDFSNSYLTIRGGDTVTERKELLLGKVSSDTRRIGTVDSLSGEVDGEATVSWRPNKKSSSKAKESVAVLDNICFLRRLRSKKIGSDSIGVGSSSEQGSSSGQFNAFLKAIVADTISKCDLDKVAILALLAAVAALVYRRRPSSEAPNVSTDATAAGTHVGIEEVVDREAMMALPPGQLMEHLSSLVHLRLSETQPPQYVKELLSMVMNMQAADIIAALEHSEVFDLIVRKGVEMITTPKKTPVNNAKAFRWSPSFRKSKTN